MLAKARKWAACAVMLGYGWTVGDGGAQELPSAPVPLAQGQGGGMPLAGPAYSPPPAPAYAPPPGPPPLPPPPYASNEDRNGNLLVNDPLLDRPMAAPPGWFADFEVGFVHAHIKNKLTSPVAVDGFADTVQLPTADLDWMGMPRIDLGYRFPEGFGAILLSYRSLVNDGHAVVPNFDVDGSDGLLRSRLNVNTLDVDYASNEYAIFPHWLMKWNAGIRVGGVFFDSQAFGPILEQRVSNNFVGAGPHLGLELERKLPLDDLGFYTRMEGSALIGKVRQGFEETFAFPDGSMIGGANEVKETQVVPDIALQVGFTWTPACYNRYFRIVGGYEIEEWWSVGRAGPSRADLTVQGVFFRAEVGF